MRSCAMTLLGSTVDRAARGVRRLYWQQRHRTLRYMRLTNRQIRRSQRLLARDHVRAIEDDNPGRSRHQWSNDYICLALMCKMTIPMTCISPLSHRM
nr:hypothetical protein CFP56_16791 [Quercus suber]